MSIEVSKKTNQEQRRYMKDRLQSIRRSKPSRYTALDIPEPKQIKAANAAVNKYSAVLESWEKRKREILDKRSMAIEKAHNDCQRAILFGNTQEALAALDKFESQSF